MTILRICWTIDGITLLVALYVFFDGLATDTPEYGFYIGWFALLSLLMAGLLGSYWLLNHDHPRWAILVASVPAILATLAGLWMLLLLLLYKQGGNSK
ncbi:osmoprotectant transporter permease [Spirosoma flavum]|uniref:Osmoprotectant transporter permease n=1 Tax=Spirosoma flavum TaxID=2048557 RepID=A0ABW6ALR1_9BACT